MTSSYLLTPLAETDLEEIWLYTARRWSPEQAEIYTNDIIDACEDLVSGRKSGRPVAIRDGYFKTMAGRHIIYFQRRAETLLVVRILHQRMDIKSHL
ncbi:type II toxin-antitoxin system RelE/ParE family toxin [Paracoccus aerodenitrificans]|uniref:type II toxin-antitoxin system RelE/ParE family toxin n=1 Tax=Paracoccus aerodenitrificans TaxID=3017781 RepID=UPI0022F0ED78|nr:type II toxin-antitoxin system RelE/ParE family toxin [Paracoccus aerodenitrificans]WBU64272.1 type II toxin-antitoxin system RelE/ParE family toxin [Paracoccus aerodenitrificans]